MRSSAIDYKEGLIPPHTSTFVLLLLTTTTTFPPHHLTTSPSYPPLTSYPSSNASTHLTPPPPAQGRAPPPHHIAFTPPRASHWLVLSTQHGHAARAERRRHCSGEYRAPILQYTPLSTLLVTDLLIFSPLLIHSHPPLRTSSQAMGTLTLDRQREIEEQHRISEINWRVFV